MTTRPASARDFSVRRASVRWITTFGLGYCRPASGTWGSLPTAVYAGAVIGVAHLLHAHVRLDGAPTERALWWAYYGGLALILVVFTIACVREGAAAEARFGKKDPGQAVADETAGQAIPLLAIAPQTFLHNGHAAGAVLAAFLLFRLFDIVKPWPARSLQRIPGGWGIVIDDLIAGLYAAVAMIFVCRTPWLA